MYYLKLISQFVRASAQKDLAYRANFFINLLHSLLNLATGVMGVVVLFSQIEKVNGWNYQSTLAILGVYLIVSALRGLFIGPSLEALAGIGQEVWSGGFDFSLLRPVNVQFLVSFRYWNLFAFFDLALGIGVFGVALAQPGQALSLGGALAFGVALIAGLAVLYAVLLAFTALTFWSPGFMFTWVFDSLFQLARYPVRLYPEWLRFVLTWIIPVGVMTTVPVEALNGQASPLVLGGVVLLAIVLVSLASALFRLGLRRYASASS